jgi:hypothetical protein
MTARLSTRVSKANKSAQLAAGRQGLGELLAQQLLSRKTKERAGWGEKSCTARILTIMSSARATASACPLKQPGDELRGGIEDAVAHRVVNSSAVLAPYHLGLGRVGGEDKVGPFPRQFVLARSAIASCSPCAPPRYSRNDRRPPASPHQEADTTHLTLL